MMGSSSSSGSTKGIHSLSLHFYRKAHKFNMRTLLDWKKLTEKLKAPATKKSLAGLLLRLLLLLVVCLVNKLVMNFSALLLLCVFHERSLMINCRIIMHIRLNFRLLDDRSIHCGGGGGSASEREKS